ncbi:RDD family protein [Alterisphingorhabdus coralli]|uniref:RDD family protein n=1 Tax=Alterisphingorhabdus coralli TaxID=3071408 RepID=A0AA97F9T9_9SPHN|nr:RDD family protein [Parasphingorhabdus sp. SCSIO 66989]WOE76176.1 RDD family protein [Parasphingorhabdus sp. SCSIO 66989]
MMMAGKAAPALRQSGLRKFDRMLVTPEGVGLNISVASASTRFGALMLDMVFINLIYIAYFLVLTLLFSLLGLNSALMFEGKAEALNGIVSFLFVVSIIFVFLVRNGYFLYFELSPQGATWGKRILGIRVASRDGGRLAPEAVVARNLLREVELFLPIQFIVLLMVQGNSSTLTLWAGVIWVLIFAFFLLFNKDRMRCGDLIAGTWVVHAPKQQLTEVVAPQDSMASAARHGADYRFSDAELAIYGEYELQTLERVLRDRSEESERTVYVAICNKLGWEPGSGDERAFLENYYTQLRQKLESGMRFGKRRANKYEREG